MKAAAASETLASVPELLSTEAARHGAARQTQRVEALLRRRLEELPPEDYANLIMGVIEEDEWLVYLMGAVLGGVVGVLQLGLLI